MDNGTGLCAYVITRDRRLDLAGAPDLGPEIAPRLLARHGLGLVVAEVPLARFAELDVDPSRDTAAPTEDSPLAVLARQHDAVVRAVFRHGPVLPLRFGTVVHDEDAAVRLLDECHGQARTWLDRVDGCREWGVRVRPAPAAEQPRPERPTGVSGAEYLALRAQQLTAGEQARQRRSDGVRRLHDALVSQASDSTFRGRAPDVLLDAAYLVAAGQEAAFRATVERFATEFSRDHLTVETTGPWPPYSFSRIEVTARA